jgi:NAD(P)-dependent dehydrogenase (short-subunit alcohol dehydrogenase family)
MKLKGRVTLITGAGGSIGRGLVGAFLAEGARVVAADISEQNLAALAKEFPGVTTVVANVATPEGADKAVAAAGDELEIVCNNAGISDIGAFADMLSDDTWLKVIDVNLNAAFLVSRRALKVMIARKRGVFVNTASVAGLRGGRTGAAYTASKWGLVGLTQNIASTLGPLGIRSNCICPGTTEGPMQKQGPQYGARDAALADQRAQYPAETLARIQANRTRDHGVPPRVSIAAVTAAAVFLASDDAMHINGVALPVDGGWLAH